MNPFLQDRDFTLHVGDVREILPRLDAGSVDCVVTSPPYWGLRDYNAPGQLGLEATPDLYVAEVVAVFRQVRRVLAPHGTCWVNLGDSYSSIGAKPGGDLGSYTDKQGVKRTYVRAPHKVKKGTQKSNWASAPRAKRDLGMVERETTLGDWSLKPKDLVGIPWRVAFALQADGWYLRSDIVWSKPNPMPESVTDRPTKSHEYVFLLTKGPRYFFDQEAVREPAEWQRWGDQTNGKHEGQQSGAGWIGSASKEELQRRATKTKKPDGWDTGAGGHGTVHRAGREKGAENYVEAKGRNVRSVWEIATQPYPEAHFATFPEALPERCIKAGCPEQVCVVCGKPRERIVERRANPAGIAGGEHREVGRSGGIANGRPRDYEAERSIGTGETVGWSECGCESGSSSGFSAIHVRSAQSGHSPAQPSPNSEYRAPHVRQVSTAAKYRPGVVLDPFMGSGTVALVARRLGRRSVGVELSPEYADLAARRLQQLSLLAEASA